MLEITDWQEKLSDLLGDFGRSHDWQWQAGTNGRSGGYVVLYKGGIQPSGYKSYCTHCGQLNYKEVPEGQTGICGRCDSKARVNFQKKHMQIFTPNSKPILPTTRQGYNRKCLIFLSEVLLSFTCKF